MNNVYHPKVYIYKKFLDLKVPIDDPFTYLFGPKNIYICNRQMSGNWMFTFRFRRIKNFDITVHVPGLDHALEYFEYVKKRRIKYINNDRTLNLMSLSDFTKIFWPFIKTDTLETRLKLL